MLKYPFKFGIALACLLLSYSLQADDGNTYLTSNRLFHVERSKNKNIVCYDVEVNATGAWDSSNPVKVYWVNREERPGEQNGLSYIQRKLAFGYKTVSHSTTSATIAINACSDRPIRIVKQQLSYVCVTSINNQELTLRKIYVKTKDSNSMKVEYVELYGVNSNGEQVVERITA